MHWAAMVRVAKQMTDVSEEEWGRLYVSRLSPTEEQKRTAAETGKEILVRNSLIRPSTPIDIDNRMGVL